MRNGNTAQRDGNQSIIESLEHRRLMSGHPLAVVNPPVGGTVTGAVFNDLNHNGNLDVSDTRLSKVQVFLDLNKNGVADDNEPSVLTDINGLYKFTGLKPGRYRVAQITPDGLINLSASGQFSDVVVRAGQTVYSNFTDLKPTATANISGTIFNDINGDRIHQDNEPGLSQWRVYLDLNLNGRFDAGEPAVFTGADGVYQFDSVATGRYLLRPEFPDSWSTDNYLAWYVNSAGKDVTGKDFAATHNAVISGVIFEDADDNGQLDASETPAAGVQVYLDANNNGKLDKNERWWVTGSSGTYTFFGVAPGNVTLRLVSNPNYTFTSADVYTLKLVDGQMVFNENFAVQATVVG